MKKRKRIIVLILGCILAVMILQFSMVRFMKTGDLPKRPNAYGKARWVSESPDVWFEVDGEDERIWQGELTIGGKTYPCKAGIDLYSIYFWKGESDTLQECEEKDILMGGVYHYLPEKSIPEEIISDVPEKLVVDVYSGSRFFPDKKLEFIRCP